MATNTPTSISDPFARSTELWDNAVRFMPAGVPTPNAYQEPHAFFDRAQGQYLYDIDGNRYLDMKAGNSATPLGNNPPEVRQALEERLAKGWCLSGQAGSETVELAEEICRRVPSVESVTMGDSGSRVTHYAVRLARAFTGREKFAKMVGGFHGSWDGALYGMPSRYLVDPKAVVPPPGTSLSTRDDVVLLPYNKLEECNRLIEESAADLGSVILEPVMGEGYIPPLPGFLEGLRKTCDKHGVVLIFDEMITLGLAPGGAQEIWGVVPDLTTMGKVVGGGLPIGLVGGRREIMELADPRRGSVVPNGHTFYAHPMSVAAGLAQLRLMTNDVYERLHERGDRVRAGVRKIATEVGVDLQVTGVGHLFHLHWTAEEVVDYDAHYGCDRERMAFFAEFLFKRGYVSALGQRFHLSTPMTDDDLDGFLDAVRDSAIAVK